MKIDLQTFSHEVGNSIHLCINLHVVHSPISHLSENLLVVPYFKVELNLQKK